MCRRNGVLQQQKHNVLKDLASEGWTDDIAIEGVNITAASEPTVAPVEIACDRDMAPRGLT